MSNVIPSMTPGWKVTTLALLMLSFSLSAVADDTSLNGFDVDLCKVSVERMQPFSVEDLRNRIAHPRFLKNFLEDQLAKYKGEDSKPDVEVAGTFAKFTTDSKLILSMDPKEDTSSASAVFDVKIIDPLSKRTRNLSIPVPEGFQVMSPGRYISSDGHFVVFDVKDKSDQNHYGLLSVSLEAGKQSVIDLGHGKFSPRAPLVYDGKAYINFEGRTRVYSLTTTSLLHEMDAIPNFDGATLDSNILMIPSDHSSKTEATVTHFIDPHTMMALKDVPSQFLPTLRIKNFSIGSDSNGHAILAESTPYSTFVILVDLQDHSIIHAFGFPSPIKGTVLHKSLLIVNTAHSGLFGVDLSTGVQFPIESPTWFKDMHKVGDKLVLFTNDLGAVRTFSIDLPR